MKFHTDEYYDDYALKKGQAMRFDSEVNDLAETFQGETYAVKDFLDNRWEMNKSTTRRTPDIVKVAGPNNFFKESSS